MNFGPLPALSAVLVLLVAQRCRIWLFQGEDCWPQTRDQVAPSDAGIADRRRAMTRIREIMQDPELYYDYGGDDAMAMAMAMAMIGAEPCDGFGLQRRRCPETCSWPQSDRRFCTWW